jgi:hypothetical protein
MKFRLPPTATPLLVGSLLALCAGCRFDSPPALNVWAVGDMVRITTDMQAPEVSPVASAQFDRVFLTAAANQTVAFQMVIEAGDEPIEAVTIDIGQLTDDQGRTADQASITPYHMLPVAMGEAPAWLLRMRRPPTSPPQAYEILDPIEPDRSFDLAPNGRLVLWFDVRVGHNTLPGDYTAPIRVNVDGKQHQSVALQTEVLDLVNPDALPLLACGGFDHRDLYAYLVRRNGKPYRPVRLNRQIPEVRQGLVHIRRLMVLARKHGLDLFDRALHPMMKRNLDGSIDLDWSDYDNIALPYLQGSAFADALPVRMWLLPVSPDWPSPDPYQGDRDPAYVQTLRNVTRECMEHLRQLGAGDRVAAWCWRGPVSQHGYEVQSLLAARIRDAAPAAAILSTLPVPLPELTTWRIPRGFLAGTDLLAPPGRWFASRAQLPVDDQRQAPPLAGRWLQPALPLYGPGLSLWAEPTGPRGLCWFGLRHGTRGLLIPDVLNWPGDPGRGLDTAPDAGRLFYPMNGQVTASATLKRLRSGLQDIGLLWILQQRGRDAISQSLLTAMVHYMGLSAAGDHYLDPRLGGWQSDGRSWRLARQLLLREAVLAVHPENDGNRRKALALRLQWNQFAQQTRRIRVERIRTRTEPLPPAAGDEAGLRMRTRVLVDLYNEYRRDASVEISLTDQAPPGFGPARAQLTIPSQTRGQAVLTVTHAPLRLTGDGKGDLELLLASDQGPERRLTTPLAMLRADWMPSPPEIDGSLRDWPLSPAGRGRNFALLAAEAHPQRPTQPTSVQVGRDDRYLYLGFQCREDDPSGLVARSTNFVAYEHLQAVEEDLLEVLLDPGARARSAADLYHLIVKPTGVVVTERGVSSQPPLGPTRPWPVAVKVATRRTDVGWTVELAIPLSALGPDRYRVWGVNFSRYRPRGQESSNWAETTRYLYDPRNLGTLVLQEQSVP